VAITWTRYSATTDNATASFVVTSPSLTLAVDDVVVAMYCIDDNFNAGTLTISNSGSALTWNSIVLTNTAGNCKVRAWWAKLADATARTVTVTNTVSDSQTKRLHCIVHTGAHLTDPVPTGNVFSGVSTTDVSQSITPTATGSALWMLTGDWDATNTFAGRTDCTLEDNFHDAGQMSSALIRPTTQPRTDAAPFTIGETDTGGQIAWLAFEVQATADAPVEGPKLRVSTTGRVW
jgi:hypothetical protein